MASGCRRADPLAYHLVKQDRRGTSLMDSKMGAGYSSIPTSDMLGLLICTGIK